MRQIEHTSVEMQIAPMIDVCFLLLFFYILTSKPAKPEADMSLTLPGTVSQEESVEMPDEQRIQIREDGVIVLNDQSCGDAGDTVLTKLVSILTRFRESAESGKTTALVTLDPDDRCSHQRIIDVLNACSTAGIRGVTFSDSEELE